MMPEEPETTPTTHDPETPTDHVETPATEDGETSKPTTDRKFAFLSRHITALRALRLSGIITLFPAIALHIYSGSIGDNFDILKEHFSYILFPAIFLSLLIWFWSSLYNTFRRLIALFFALCSVTSAGFLMHRWWRPYDQPWFMPGSLVLWWRRLCNQPWFMPDFLVRWQRRLYDQPSFYSAFLLSLGLASLGLGLLITTDLLLRGVRDRLGAIPGSPDDPAKFASYRASADSVATREQDSLVHSHSDTHCGAGHGG